MRHAPYPSVLRGAGHALQRMAGPLILRLATRTANLIRHKTLHAVGWRTPSARCSSNELMPFLALAISHIATNHCESGSGLSSKTVPTFVENCLRHPFALHCIMARLAML